MRWSGCLSRHVWRNLSRSVETLKKLWAEDLSASAIASRLGDVSRNAVIGKVHRLGLAGRVQRGGRKIPQPSQAELDAAVLVEETAEAERLAKIARATEMAEARRQAKAARIALETAKPIAVIAPVSPPIVLAPTPVEVPKVLEFPKTPEPKGVTIFELRNSDKKRGIVGTCKYPLGARLEFAERFCGKPVRNGRPYCPECCSIAYVPMKRRIFAPIAKHNTASLHRVFDAHTN